LVTQEEIFQTLDAVKDPELEVSILDHQMISGIEVKDGGKRVQIRLAFQQKMTSSPAARPSPGSSSGESCGT